MLTSDNVKKWIKKPLIVLFVFSVILISSIISFQKLISNPDGYTGVLDGGCSCHTSQSTATTLTTVISSGNWSVKPNSTNDITITVNNATKKYAGIDFGVKDATSGGNNIGTLTAKTACKIMSGELTHTSPKTLVSGKFSFVGTWKAPATPGLYYLRAVGNATSGNGTSGCAWAIMSPQTISVIGITACSAPTTGSNVCIGGTFNINWNQIGISNLKLELSTDNGASFPTVITASTPADAGTYSWSVPSSLSATTSAVIRISDALDATTTLNSATFSLVASPQITIQPQSKATCVNQTVSLSVTATGSNLSYQWKKGSNSVGTNSNTLTLNNVQLSDAGDYSVTVTNTTCNTSTTSDVCTLTVANGITINSQPTNQTGCIGGTATFTAGVSAGAGTTYQWDKDGVNIPGQIAATLVLNVLSQSDVGTYILHISNQNCNLNLSTNPVTLTVNKGPLITKQPESVSVCVGKTATFSVELSDPNVTYAWRKNGVIIPNATQASYTTNALVMSDSGSYDVSISSSCGSPIISQVAKLNVIPTPVILTQPKSITAKIGTNATFSVELSTNSNNTFEWKKDGKTLAGQNSASISIQNIKLSDSGSYQVIITNTCGNITSNTAVLKVTTDKIGPNISTISSNVVFAKTMTLSTKDSTIIALIQNTGDENLIISEISLDKSSPNGSDFQVLTNSVPYTITPTKTLDVKIRFNPKTDGSKTATLNIISNAPNPNNTISVNLSGLAYTDANQPKIAFSSNSLEYGTVDEGKMGLQTLTINNNDNKQIKILSAVISDPFSLISPSLPSSIDAGTSKDFFIKFTPTTQGIFNSFVFISIEGIANPFIIKLIGVARPSSVDWLNQSDNEFVNISPNPQMTDSPILIQVKNEEIDKLTIYNEFGVIINEININGLGNITWDANSSSGIKCPTGIYFIKIHSKYTEKMQKLMIIK